MCFKFVAPLVHNRHSRDGGGIAERAEGATKHVLRQVLDVINVLFHTRAIVEAGKGFLEPVCTLAAGNAPSAALVLVKLHDAEREFDHACSLIEDDHAAGAEELAALGEAVEIHVDGFSFFGSKNKGGGAAGDHGLELLAARDAAADLVNHLLQGIPER